MLNEKNRQNQDSQQQLGSNRELLSRKEMEINQAKGDLAQKSDQGYQLRKDMENLQYEISKLKEERARDFDELERLRDLSSYRQRENQEQTQRIKSTDYELQRSQSSASEL